MESLPIISKFMDKVVPTLSPDTKILDAVEFLLQHKVTGAPVVDGKGRLLGIITETDLLSLVTKGVQSQPPTDATVSDYMTHDVVTVGPDTDIYYVAGVFLSHHFRRLPVVDNGKIVGAITRYDLLRVVHRLAAGPLVLSA
ncbi:MAG: CBS domain-containing protein [Lysobacterales bacterium]|jgi:CBS domain-containing protein